MKATSGKLRLDQSYKILKSEYTGKFSDFSFMQCENCGKPICNIVTVKGSEDGKLYEIGTDCATTLSGIVPSELAQIKKQLGAEAKCRKWINDSAESFWIEETPDYKIWYGFEIDMSPELAQEKVNRRLEMRNRYSPEDTTEIKFTPYLEKWIYKGRFSKYEKLIAQTGKPVYYVEN